MDEIVREELLLRLAEDGELNVVLREVEEVEEADEVEMVETKLLESDEDVVSGEFHGPWRMGRVVPVVGAFQGPCRVGKAGRATVDVMRKAIQCTSSVLCMVTCNPKQLRES